MELRDARGNKHIWSENNRKWREVLNEFLVDTKTMVSVNGGKYKCSYLCYGESLEYGSKYQFVDTARLALTGCVHTSHHLQCLLSSFITGANYTSCPIADTPQCRGECDHQAGS